MKKLLGLFLCVMLVGFFAAPVGADILVVDQNLSDEWTNPDKLPNSGWATEEAWLQALLDNPAVQLIGEDDDGSNGWQTPSDWTYAVLKYGAPQAPDTGLDHYAIYNDDGGSGINFSGLGLSTHALSHIRYDNPVPEPATLLLLGTGLIGLAGAGRKKIFK